MDDNSVNYSRQESLKLVVPKKVAVVGCGGVGSWTAYLLAMAGVPEIWIFDFDHVEEHNLNRIPFPPSSVGMLKTEACAKLIATVRPKCSVLAMGKFDHEIVDALSLKYEQFDWIICTTDSLSSRQMTWEITRRCYADEQGLKRTKYIEASAEGEFGGCTGEPAEWSTDAEANPGYQWVPVWNGPAIAAAMSACAYVLHGQEPGDDNIRLGWEEGPDEDGKVRGVFAAQVHSDHVIVDEDFVEEEEETEENEQTEEAKEIENPESEDWGLNDEGQLTGAVRQEEADLGAEQQ